MKLAGTTVVARVLLPFALCYFVSYCFRNVNAVIAPDLRADLGLGASGLGALTAAYFLAFSAAQLPLGIALDRYGPRRVEAALLLFAAAGAGLFALADDVVTLTVARAFIGLGVASCLMGAIKATTQWFSADRQPLAVGCITAFGGLGALAATAPVEAALRLTDWRGVFLALAAFTLACAVLLFFAVPRREDESRAGVESLRQQVAGIGRVLGDRRFQRIAPLVVANAGCFMAIQGLWAGPWLSDVAGLPREAVASTLLFIAGAMVAGFLGLGVAADRLARVGVSALYVAIAASVVTVLANLAFVVLPNAPPLAMWLPYGFFGTCGTLFFPVLARGFDAGLSGRVVTTLNVFVFGAAFGVQWGLGVILDGFAAPDGFSDAGYAAAFGAAVALQLVALVWLMAGWRHVIDTR